MLQIFGLLLIAFAIGYSWNDICFWVQKQKTIYDINRMLDECEAELVEHQVTE